MLAEYFPVLLFMAVSAVIGVALIAIGNLLGPKNAGAEKDSPYECGFEAFEDARMKFDVRYYLIAILFIIFDLEIAFVLPWATVFSKLGLFGLIEMAMFLGLLVLQLGAHVSRDVEEERVQRPPTGRVEHHQQLPGVGAQGRHGGVVEPRVRA